MVQKKNRRRCHLKINGDTMTTIVVSSLLFCVTVVIVTVVIWGMLQASNGIDSSAIVDSALRIFGTELGICGVMTIFQRWTAAQDRRAEERQRRREERRLRE